MHTIYKSACNFYLENILNFTFISCVRCVCFFSSQFLFCLLEFCQWGLPLPRCERTVDCANNFFFFVAVDASQKYTLNLNNWNFELFLRHCFSCHLLSYFLSLFLILLLIRFICFMLVAFLFLLSLSLYIEFYLLNVYLRKTNSSNSKAERQRNRESHSLIIIAQKQELNVLPAFLTSYG